MPTLCIVPDFEFKIAREILFCRNRLETKLLLDRLHNDNYLTYPAKRIYGNFIPLKRKIVLILRYIYLSVFIRATSLRAAGLELFITISDVV